MTEQGETEAIKQANLGFYRAFESLDITQMADCWLLDHSSVKCIHPGWPMLVGWEDIALSWQRIFDNSAAMQFTITDVDVMQEGDWAWVTCTENLISVVNGRVTEGKVQATNIFKNRNGLWLLVHHHGSPCI